jgi:phage N-6-adenine-methyltransferase
MPKNEANNKDTRREDWATPQWLFDELNKVFDFWIDLAASTENKKCERFIDKEMNFLSMDKSHLVPDDKWAWCNPPYLRNGCGKWVEEIFKIHNSVTLIPASVGAKWFQQIWQKATAICFVDRRLRFVGAPCAAQFDSCLVIKSEISYCRPYDAERRRSVLRSLGNVVFGVYPRLPR